MLDLTIAEWLGGGSLIAVVGMTILQIAPIKIDPWTALARAIGRAINGEIMTEVASMKTELGTLRHELNERAAKDARIRILRFGDEILHDEHHSKEHFDQILQDITEYDHYCETHPHFKNNMTVMTTAHIKETYAKCFHDHSFL